MIQLHLIGEPVQTEALALSSPLGLAVQQGPNSPIGDWLGYLVLFAVVVWPILRGIIESANSKRREFDRSQRRTRGSADAGADPSGPARKRRTLEEILTGEPTYDESMDEDARPSPPAAFAPPVPPAGDVSSKRRTRAQAEDAHDAGSLVGDPFDERSMNRELVDQSSLRHVPSESAMESAQSGRFDAGDANSKKRFEDLGYTAAAMQTVGGEASRGSSDQSLRRLEREYSAWQRAFIMREILGPPRSAESFGDRRF